MQEIGKLPGVRIGDEPVREPQLFARKLITVPQGEPEDLPVVVGDSGAS